MKISMRKVAGNRRCRRRPYRVGGRRRLVRQFHQFADCRAHVGSVHEPARRRRLRSGPVARRGRRRGKAAAAQAPVVQLKPRLPRFSAREDLFQRMGRGPVGRPRPRRPLPPRARRPAAARIVSPLRRSIATTRNAPEPRASIPKWPRRRNGCPFGGDNLDVETQMLGVRRPGDRDCRPSCR